MTTDIFEYAESINYGADYLDMKTGKIFKIQDYGHALKSGLPTRGIEVVDSLTGDIIGILEKK